MTLVSWKKFAKFTLSGLAENTWYRVRIQTKNEKWCWDGRILSGSTGGKEKHELWVVSSKECNDQSLVNEASDVTLTSDDSAVEYDTVDTIVEPI